jgi:O-methyltransferase involved in polyketide biosynthesis
MQSAYDQSGPPALIRDPLAEDLIGAFSRQAKARLSPQPARNAGGKSLVPFWRRWWRSL